MDRGGRGILPPVPGSAWIDRNDDGREDGDETIAGFNDIAAYWSAGWTRPDLTVITHSLHIYRPQGFTPGGVPLYDFAKPEIPKNPIALTPYEQGATGNLAMDDAGNLSDGISFHTITGKQGKYPNRYARHDAPAAQRGVLIAPFRANGVVEGVPGVGAITALGAKTGSHRDRGERQDRSVRHRDALHGAIKYRDVPFIVYLTCRERTRRRPGG